MYILCTSLTHAQLIVYPTKTRYSCRDNINTLPYHLISRGPDGWGLSIQFFEPPLFHSLDLISFLTPFHNFCEILIAEAKRVLLIIIMKRKNLINIYFPHKLTYATTKLVSSTGLVGCIQLTRSVDETSFVVAYVNVCEKLMLMRFFLFNMMLS